MFHLICSSPSYSSAFTTDFIMAIGEFVKELMENDDYKNNTEVNE